MKWSLGYLKDTMKGNKACLALLVIQVVYAGRYLFAKAAIANGMSPYVFVFYRQGFASIALAPLAFFLERDKSAPPPFKLLCKIFFVAFCGITVSLNLDTYSLNYISATFAAAIGNTVPAMTFFMAVILRMESLAIKQRHGLAKVLGSIISLLGAMVFILVKGPPMYSTSHKGVPAPSMEPSSRGDWLKGSLAAISSNIAWSLWIIMQGPILKQYPAKIRMTTLQTFFSCIQSGLWAAAMDRNISAWKLEWDLNLLSVTYCGIIFTAITYWLRIWVIDKKGPVFLAMFSPLTFIITAGLSAIFWKETLHWGSLCGAILMVGGLYGFLWGQKEEAKEDDKVEQKQVELKPDINQAEENA